MSSQQALIAAKPQLIPTNEGGRTFAAPPAALQTPITPNELFYIRNHWKEPPRLDLATYRLQIDSESGRRLSLSLPEIFEFPQKRLQVTLECCGNSPVPEYWAKQTRSIMEKVTGHGILSNAEWAGVSLALVLERAGLKSSAKEVVFTGADHGPDEVVGDPPEVTYQRALPVAKAMHPDTLLAYEMNGEALPVMHGCPLRLIVPGWYGMTSVKWLVGISAIDHAFDGFYQRERYMVMNGPEADTFYTYLTEIKVKSIITDPMPGEIVPLGIYRVAGAAWSGEQEIVRVEISTDGAQTWHEAHLSPRINYSWYRWEFLWQPPSAGSYILMSRATNNKGETQPMEFPNKWDGRSYGNNMVFRHPVEVRGASGRS
jgi:DMSO/TMAO reductase YedYZ molybdopterin-dependent catalytic subunit